MDRDWFDVNAPAPTATRLLPWYGDPAQTPAGMYPVVAPNASPDARGSIPTAAGLVGNPNFTQAPNAQPPPVPSGGAWTQSGSRPDPNNPGFNLDGTLTEYGAGGTDLGAVAGGTSSLLDPWTREFAYPSFDPSGLPGYQTFVPAAFQAPGAFVAPTAEEAAQDPGYQFAIKQAQKGLEGSAAARGTLLTGGTLKGINDYMQAAAAQQYGNVYGRRFGERQQAFNEAYQPWAQGTQLGISAAQVSNAATSAARENALSTWLNNYNKAVGEYANARDVFYANQDRPYNKLTGLMNIGQRAAEGATSAGQNVTDASGNILVGQQGGEYGTQAANARAAGLVGSANAWSNLGPAISGTAMDAYWINQMMNPAKKTKLPGSTNYGRYMPSGSAPSVDNSGYYFPGW